MAEKKKELTEQQQKFLDALFYEAKGDIKKALEIAGYSPHTRPSDILKTLREEIIETAKNSIALNAPRAAFELFDVMNNPAKSGASNALKAAQQVLDRVGIQSKAEGVDLKVPSGGLLILPAKSATVESEITDEDNT